MDSVDLGVAFLVEETGLVEDSDWAMARMVPVRKEAAVGEGGSMASRVDSTRNSGRNPSTRLGNTCIPT